MINTAYIVETYGMGIFALFILLFIWSLIWKGFALWMAAQREHKYWFITLLILNTFGILDIIYIFAVAGRQDKNEGEEVGE